MFWVWLITAFLSGAIVGLFVGYCAGIADGATMFVKGDC